MNATALAGAWSASRFASLAIDAVRAIRWPQIRATMLLGLAATVWTWLVYLRFIVYMAQRMPLWSLILDDLIQIQMRALCFLVAIVIADRAVDEGAPRRRAYVLAALAGCVAGVLIAEPILWAWEANVVSKLYPERPTTWLHGTTKYFYGPIKSGTHWLLIGGAFVFLYADRRAARKTAQLLRDAELDRIRRSRLALESRLQAMQARVEPQFLFNTLAQVERLYEQDAPLAGRMLDDLIAYLRAAMPRMRDTSSTVGQEIDLARAYLDIVRLRLDDRLAIAISVAEEVRAQPMPPMMLLPLIDHAVVYGIEKRAAAGSLRIAAAAHEGQLRLVIMDSGAGFVPENGRDGIASIRDRLTALYGEDAHLELRRVDDTSSEAVMDVPYESMSAGEQTRAEVAPASFRA